MLKLIDTSARLPCLFTEETNFVKTFIEDHRTFYTDAVIVTFYIIDICMYRYKLDF